MKFLFFVLLSTTIAFASLAQNNLYQFTVKDIYGNDYPLKQLKGKKVMVVNTASKCGLTPQYDALQELYEKYKNNNFVVIAFPANNFLSQEPGSDKEILDFCTSEFNISFPIMSKISVKGKDIHPLYQWLTQKSKNGKVDAPVKWNFQKFLIDEKGEIVEAISPRKSPKSKEIIEWINP